MSVRYFLLKTHIFKILNKIVGPAGPGHDSRWPMLMPYLLDSSSLNGEKDIKLYRAREIKLMKTGAEVELRRRPMSFVIRDRKRKLLKRPEVE